MSDLQPAPSASADANGPGLHPALLEALVASAMDAIVVVDETQRIVLFNAAAERMFGCRADEAMGTALSRFLPDRFHGVHRRYVSEFMTTGETGRAMGHLRPLAARRCSGEEFPIEATISQVTIDGRRYGAAIVRDITARERAERERAAALARESAARAEAVAVAAERDRLRQLLDGLPTGVLILDAPGGASQFANAKLLEWIFGSGAAPAGVPVYGRDYTFFRADGVPLPSHDRPGLRALRGEPVDGQQLIMQCAGGNRFPVSAHASPLHDGDGTIQSAIVVILDMTSARQAEQLKDDFLALISHEFRTPLTAIHGGAHLLAYDSGNLDDAARLELLQDVVTESERLDRMLANILMLANVLGGRLRVETEPVLIGPIVGQVTAEVEKRAPLHRFIVRLPASLPPIEADPNLLEEVLRNLYENAVKYAPQGGAITTRAAVVPDGVALQVSDEGIGIAPEHVTSVFERFRRVGGDPTVRGMGLGLYLSRHLVDVQKGRIEVHSEGLGRGTTFSVVLPIAQGWDATDAGHGSTAIGDS